MLIIRRKGCREASFTTLGLVGRKQHCYHLHQELVYSFEQMVPIGLVRHCFAMVWKVKRLVGMNWS